MWIENGSAEEIESSILLLNLIQALTIQMVSHYDIARIQMNLLVHNKQHLELLSRKRKDYLILIKIIMHYKLKNTVKYWPNPKLGSLLCRVNLFLRTR